MSFLGEYVAMRNNKFKLFGFSADSVLKFSTEIDIFTKFPQNENFSIFSLDYPVQCCPEKAILMQKFWSWYLMEIFSGRFNGKSTAPLNSTRSPVEN